MNFQTSKRIMCCLLAALILCCAVVRPIEASATGLGALVAGKIVGFALEPAISSILIALGVTGTAAAFTELVKNISQNVPAEYIITALDGTEYLSAVSYNDITYVAQELVEWVLQSLRGFKAEVEPVYGLDFVGVTKLTNVGTLYEDVMSAVNTSTQAVFCNKWRPLIAEAKKCYSIVFEGTTSYGGLYYWGETLPEFKFYSNASYGGVNYSRLLQVTIPDGGVIASQSDTGVFSLYAGGTVTFPNVYEYTINQGYGTAATISLAENIASTDQFHATVPDYETWVYPGIHIIILPEDPEPSEPTEPEETEPPESEPPESQPAVPPTPSEPTPSEPEPEVTDPVEIPDTTVPSETEPETPEETEPVENPNKYETYIPVTLPNTILDPNVITQPEVQTGQESAPPEFESNETVEIQDPNKTESDESTSTDTDTEWGEPVVWPDFPSLDTPEVPFPGTDNDYTGNENDTSWLTKIGEWIKWLGELIKEWIKWLGEYIVEWLKWLGEIIQLLPHAIAYYLKLMVQWLVEAFKPLFQKLAEWLQPLMDYLLEGLKTLFIPREGYFDSKIEGLKAKFPFFNSIVGTVPAFKSFILSLGSTPPVIYIDLPSATGSWYWGARTIFLDLRWYAQYKPTMDAILSGFLWLWFIWRMILAFPGIIQGTSGFWGTGKVAAETPIRNAVYKSGYHLNAGSGGFTHRDP